METVTRIKNMKEKVILSGTPATVQTTLNPDLKVIL